MEEEIKGFQAMANTTSYNAQNAGKLHLKIWFFLQNNLNFWKWFAHKSATDSAKSEIMNSIPDENEEI